MSGRVRRVMWFMGWPPRALLLLAVKVYRLSLGPVLGGGCRFYPSCSAYAERAISEWGVIRGVPLSVWRVLRCSPLTAGGVDHPPRRVRPYDAVVHRPKGSSSPRDLLRGTAEVGQ